MKFLTTISGLTLGALMWSTAALADNSIGKVQQVVQQVSAASNLTAPTRALAVNSPVNQMELIRTGNASFAGIVLADTSTLSVGQNSTVLLDEYLFDPSVSAGKLVTTITIGAMRFVSGKLPGEGISIRTPNAVIGIRGSIVEVAVAADGTTDVNTVQGTATITTSDNKKTSVPAGTASSVSPVAVGIAPAPTPPAPPSAELLNTMQQVPEIEQPAEVSAPDSPPGTITTSQGSVSGTDVFGLMGPAIASSAAGEASTETVAAIPGQSTGSSNTNIDPRMASEISDDRTPSFGCDGASGSSGSHGSHGSEGSCGSGGSH